MSLEVLAAAAWQMGDILGNKTQLCTNQHLNDKTAYEVCCVGHSSPAKN